MDCTKEECISLLRKGELVAVYPGGIQETVLSNNNYDLVWKSRQGFANVANEAKSV